MKKRMKPWKTVLILLFILAAILVVGFVIWAQGAYPADDTALQAMNGNRDVKVTDSGSHVFFDPVSPTDATGKGKIGLIFYPGGKVKPEAYAPLLLQIAATGHPVALCRMPLNLAVLGTGAAANVLAGRPDTRWAVGGHSLGGSMAAYYAYKHPEAIAGLVLLGSYPAKGNSFAASSLPVLSVFGTKDMGIEKILQYRNLLPATAAYLELDGGNHAQFGDYGKQSGDGTATMSRLEQQILAVVAIVNYLDGLAPE